MGKIVKYCGSCDEGFAEKFGFCPNCGAGLQAFEMNPVEAQAAAEAVAVPPMPVILEAPVVAEAAPVAEVFEEPVPFEEPVAFEAAAEPEVIAAEPEIVEEVVAEPVFEAVAPKAIPVVVPVYTQPKTVDVDRVPVSLSDERDKAVNEGGFYVTVIEEKNHFHREVIFCIKEQFSYRATMNVWIPLAGTHNSLNPPGLRPLSSLGRCGRYSILG